jgi:uncharacterized protein
MKVPPHNQDELLDALLLKIIGQLRLSPHSVHGPDHWHRVRRNGLIICAEEGIEPSVLRYFSILHDSQRDNDGRDLEHGSKAVAYAEQIRGDYIDLNDHQFEQLCFSMAYHTIGAESDDPVVHACWDADRLDLGRVMITPNPERMLTETARKMCGTYITDAHFE